MKDHPECWEDYVRPICMAYNTSIHPITGFTPFHLMFGRQAKLPVELMYGTPELEPQSGTEYATQLKSSLTEAYEMVRVKTTRQLDHQAELYNKKVHGKPYKVGNHVWVLFPQEKVKETVPAMVRPLRCRKTPFRRNLPSGRCQQSM